MLAIIGGSGLSQLPELSIHHRQVVRTPYGLPSSPLLFGQIGQVQIVFLARHGFGHTLAPHEINYRANIWALHHVGATEVIAVGAVFAFDPQWAPGSLVVPDDLLDYTWGREHTFYEGESQSVVHTAFDPPYADTLRAQLLDAARQSETDITGTGVYACLQGPRFPTVAESVRLRRDGADVFGMTGMPEAILARELNLPYAHLCGVIGHAPGQNQMAPQTHTASQDTRYAAIERIRRLLGTLA